MNIRLASDLQVDSIVDGEGVRTVVWIQGCPHKCPFCHNPTTHDFDGGFAVSVDTVIDEIKNLECQDGITLSGGDPMVQPEACMLIAKAAKERGLNVWCYTGFDYEYLIKYEKYRNLLKYVDVLVDGKFMIEFRNMDLQYRGSSNQRIIDVPMSMMKNDVCLIEKYMVNKDYKPIYSKKTEIFI